MAWEWSHTPDAYANAQANVERLPKATLLEIMGEWRNHRREQKGITGKTPFQLKPHYASLTEDVLASEVWDSMETQATCDNGGFHAWACPYGCHTVSFDPPEDED